MASSVPFPRCEAWLSRMKLVQIVSDAHYMLEYLEELTPVRKAE